MKKKNIILSLIFLPLFAFSFSNQKGKESFLDQEAMQQFSNDSSYAEVYPTYFETHCYIKGYSDPTKEIRIEAFDLSGLLVKTFVLEDALTETERKLDFSDLNNKAIIVRVYEGQKLLKKVKLMKK